MWKTTIEDAVDRSTHAHTHFHIHENRTNIKPKYKTLFIDTDM